MTIQFRCQHCNQLLGIAETRAGSVVDCPKCGRSLRVPSKAGAPARMELVHVPETNPEFLSALQELSHLHPDAAPAAAGTSQAAERRAGVVSDAASARPLVSSRSVVPAPKPRAMISAAASSALSEGARESRPAEAGLLASMPADVLQSLATMKPAEDLGPAMIPEIAEPEVLEAVKPEPAAVAPVEQADAAATAADQLAGEPHSAASTADPMAQALQELADLNPDCPAVRAPLTSRPARKLPDASPLTFALMLLPGIVLGCFSIGFIAGRNFVPPDRRAEKAGQTGEKNPPPVQADSSAAGGTADGSTDASDGILSGRLLYATSPGQNEPDAGAVVLLLPLRNPTSLRFDVRSLRDAEPTPARRAVEAALSALSGSVARADKEGRYQVRRRDRGPSLLIAVSQHATRPATEPLPAPVQAMAAEWLESPSSLFGRLQVFAQVLPAADNSVTAPPAQTIPDIEFPASP